MLECLLQCSAGSVELDRLDRGQERSRSGSWPHRVFCVFAHQFIIKQTGLLWCNCVCADVCRSPSPCLNEERRGGWVNRWSPRQPSPPAHACCSVSEEKRRLLGSGPEASAASLWASEHWGANHSIIHALLSITVPELTSTFKTHPSHFKYFGELLITSLTL